MKKLLSMLMAIALVISLVPAIAASADGECDHVGTKYTYTNNGDGTHTTTCECGESLGTSVCYWENATTPCACGSYKPVEPVEPECDHVGTKYTYANNGDGTHTTTCECGEVLGTNDCVWENGKACICGSTEPACDHAKNNWEYVKLDKLHHKVVCADCGEVVTESIGCNFETGECICGNVAATSCNHMSNNWKYVPNSADKHDTVCADCGVVVSTTECVFVDGKCVCGNVEPACDHMGNNWMYVPHGATHHDVWCKDCDTLVTEKVECVFTNGECLACHNVEPACDHMANKWEYIPLDATHHKVVCKVCGETVTESTKCVFEAGKCVCGNKKPVHVNTNDKDLDNVPKTSDALAPVMVLSSLMSVASFVTKKRFF